MIADLLHPYPRYGLAAALVEQRLSLAELPEDEGKVARLAAEAIEHSLHRYMVRTRDKPMLESTVELNFEFVPAEELDPGKEHGQVAATGYYLGPHVVTNNNAADALEEVRKIEKRLRDGSGSKRCELKRSFAPLTAKVNNGTPTMSNPQADLLTTAFTAIATITPLKPGAYVGGFNRAIIPDLPLRDAETGAEPLLDFIYTFEEIRVQETHNEAWKVRLDESHREYRRPPIVCGNFPGAPRDPALGPAALAAAIGAWGRRIESFRGHPGAQWAERVLHYLSENPFYIVSYDRTQQQHFGNHITQLALEYDLQGAIRALSRTAVYGAESLRDPKRQLFRMMAGRFLQLFTPAAFRDFLAFRAEYPSQIGPVLEFYFIFHFRQMEGASEMDKDTIRSARAYGASLNRAAYLAARDEVRDDEEKRGGQPRRNLAEYKSRILVQLESTAHSAKSPAALFGQLNAIAGRLTGREIDREAELFMENVLSGEIPLAEAQQIVTAFMRLRTRPSRDEQSTAGNAEESEAAVVPAEEVIPPEFLENASSGE